MKIEKVNDSQIRCTLTRDDLASRKLKISELAYGTKKAKNLFRDMMEMASNEYGFEAENIPLMIEAIPVNSECIVLIITKVEDPEELDTRFSKFSPEINEFDDDDDSEEADEAAEDEESIKDLFDKFYDAAQKKAQETEPKKPADCNSYAFTFSTMDRLITVSKHIVKSLDATSSLYKDKSSDDYLLVVHRDRMDVSDFVKVCNLLSEYSNNRKSRHVTEAYILEHFDNIIDKDAVETLASL